MNEKEFPLTFEYLDEVGEELVSLVVSQLQNDNKNSSFVLSNSIDYDIIEVGDELKLVIEYANHGKNVLQGRKAGVEKELGSVRTRKTRMTYDNFPNIDAIKNWISNKRIVGHSVLMKKNIKSLNSLVFLIGRSIAKKGIKPYNFLSDVNKYLASDVFLKRYSEIKKQDIENQILSGLKKNKK